MTSSYHCLLDLVVVTPCTVVATITIKSYLVIFIHIFRLLEHDLLCFVFVSESFVPILIDMH